MTMTRPLPTPEEFRAMAARADYLLGVAEREAAKARMTPTEWAATQGFTITQPRPWQNAVAGGGVHTQRAEAEREAAILAAAKARRN